MEELISFQNNLLRHTDNRWHRYMYSELSKNDTRLLGVKGLRGVGKTTMFLQYLGYDYPERKKGLYVTADHPYFYKNTIFNLASEWSLYGGKLLLIDEVHKYPNWSRELKLIYDGYPDLQVFFTSSSALDLYQGESDLSRRLETITVPGLSFREYLSLKHRLHFEKYSLSDILNKHMQITPEITARVKIMPLFKDYLREGYFPFCIQMKDDSLLPRLLQVINTVLETDLLYIEDYSASNIEKIKKLLGVIAESAPFEPNISKIAEKLNLGRNTINNYLKNLHHARILHLMNKPGKGLTRLQKADKIYFENTGFAYAFQNNPDIGIIREIFFLNQLVNSGHLVQLSPNKGDFLVNQHLTFEVGGKNKEVSQLKGIHDSYFALDDMEHGFAGSVPLWLFGFLY